MPCSQVFKFKKFSICQDKVAMKVGTDGVLLGAWTAFDNPQNILDIGTGTGLIALIMAQKFAKAKIHAVEIEKNAFDKASENIQNSPWKNRIELYHTALQNFDSPLQFDIIISNPPFFNEKVPAKTLQRQWARQQKTLKPEDIFDYARQHLAKKGILNIIYPFDKKDNLLNQAKKYALFPYRMLVLKGNEKAQPKRILVSLTQEKQQVQEEILVIEKERHVYTRAYKKLVKDFYLKM